MYCPNCGQSNEIEQRFCRRCGLNLEAVSDSLAAQLERGNVEPTDRNLELFGNIAFGGFSILVLFGIVALIYTVLAETVLKGEHLIFGIGLSLFLVFAAMTLAYVVMNESRKEKLAQRKQNPEIASPGTERLLVDRPFEPVPSVVEDTTELLGVESRTRKL